MIASEGAHGVSAIMLYTQRDALPKGSSGSTTYQLGSPL